MRMTLPVMSISTERKSTWWKKRLPFASWVTPAIRASATQYQTTSPSSSTATSIPQRVVKRTWAGVMKVWRIFAVRRTLNSVKPGCISDVLATFVAIVGHAALSAGSGGVR